MKAILIRFLVLTTLLVVFVLFATWFIVAGTANAQGSVGELIQNGNFSNDTTAPWRIDGPNLLKDITGSDVLSVTVVDGGANSHDRVVRQYNIPLSSGVPYTFTLRAWASTPVTIPVVLQLNAAPYTSYFTPTLSLSTSPQTYTFHFTPTATNLFSNLDFQLGGHGAYNFYLDDVSLLGPQSSPEVPISEVRLNQVGYLAFAPKRATISDAVTTPLPWTVYDGSNHVVAAGTTTVFGLDEASQEHVHIADFSEVTTPGSGYTLDVNGNRSHPFDISNDVYKQLQYDAMAYFYHNRSGIAITMPYAGGDQWTRPAGHINVSPNRGDNNVPCYDDGSGTTTCNYTLNVPGGWYDAGDHGKYVVNGGISVWTLLNLYERAQYITGANTTAFADGTMNIPENHNGVPDILDEVRWELEFMLSMQVPATGTVGGQNFGGMVHHKIHDDSWTSLGLSPDQDAKTRYLYPPSTAATLNLAATAAQCARIWEDIDSAFANRCLSAAETAWDAARVHTNTLASNFGNGGGLYGDDYVSDEFYWAASELYITTGEQEYGDYLRDSSHYLRVFGDDRTGVITESAITWNRTASLGTFSLALVPNNLPPTATLQARANIATVADGYMATMKEEGYLLPYTPGQGKAYPWGSNSFVINNMIILGLAYDFTGDETYLGAVSEGMDYLLGRNPNDKSYVSGYGERPLRYPHHRFWAYQVNPIFPEVPPGALSGGPNFNREDPYIEALFPRAEGDCPSNQKCYADHIESYSTNEVAINWNAPLAWVAAFLNSSGESVYLPIIER